MGVVLLARGKPADALFVFRETLDVARELTAKDPENMEWRNDLAASLEYVGDALLTQHDRSGATAAYREGLDIRRKIAARDPSHIRWQTNVVLLLVRLGFLGDDSRTRWNEAMAILLPLRAKGQLDALQLKWIADIEGELAKVTQIGGR